MVALLASVVKDHKHHQRRPFVQITVHVAVDIPPGSDVNRVEDLIVAAGRQAMRQAFADAGRALEGEPVACPGCGGRELQPSGLVVRVLWTRFGKVRVPLRRLRCQRRGGASDQPPRH